MFSPFIVGIHSYTLYLKKQTSNNAIHIGFMPGSRKKISGGGGIQSLDNVLLKFFSFAIVIFFCLVSLFNLFYFFLH